MVKVRNILSCAALVAFIALLLVTTRAVLTITATINKTVDEVPHLLRIESAETRNLLREISHDYRITLERQLIASRRTLVQEIRTLSTPGRQTVASLNLTLNNLNREVSLTGGATRALLARYRRVPDEAAYATRQIWDCEGNPDCLENRYVSVSRAVEAASRSIQTTAPRMAVALESSALSAAQTTASTNLLITDARAWLAPPPRWTRHPAVRSVVYLSTVVGRIAIPLTLLF